MTFFRRLSLRLKKQAGDPDEVAADIYRKLRQEVFDRPQAEIDLKEATAAGALIESLKGTRDACIQLGSILLVKVDDCVIVRNLTSRELGKLSANPRLLTNPRTVMLELQGSSPDSE